jgi:hypothetical protein
MPEKLSLDWQAGCHLIESYGAEDLRCPECSDTRLEMIQSLSSDPDSLVAHCPACSTEFLVDLDVIAGAAVLIDVDRVRLLHRIRLALEAQRADLGHRSGAGHHDLSRPTTRAASGPAET